MKEKTKVYETVWRNKFICTETKTFDKFIETLEGAVEHLKEMRAAGIKLEDHGICDDYAFFTTENPEDAAKFGMEERDWDEEEFVGDFSVVDPNDEILAYAETLDQARDIARHLLSDQPAGTCYCVDSMTSSDYRKLFKMPDGTIKEEDWTDE